MKKAETDKNEKTTGTTSYIRIILKVLWSSVGVMIFIYFCTCIRELVKSDTSIAPKIGGLIICVSVMVVDVYMLILYFVYGQDELFRVFVCILALFFSVSRIQHFSFCKTCL